MVYAEFLVKYTLVPYATTIIHGSNDLGNVFDEDTVLDLGFVEFDSFL